MAVETHTFFETIRRRALVEQPYILVCAGTENVEFDLRPEARDDINEHVYALLLVNPAEKQKPQPTLRSPAPPFKRSVAWQFDAIRYYFHTLVRHALRRRARFAFGSNEHHGIGSCYT